MRCSCCNFAGVPIVLATLVLACTGYFILRDAIAQEGPDWNKGLPRQHKSKWLVSDGTRPQPTVVKPGAEPGAPPADAIVLFDGKDLSKWKKSGTSDPAGWKVENGYVEMTPTGSISTVEKFGDLQLHIEWRAPTPPKGNSQGRGNSGIFLMDRYELQVLDSFDNKTYADGSAASIYAQHPPLVNACRPPGEWQAYDVVFRAPRFKDGKLADPGRMTVFHNGVVVQHDAEVFGSTVYRELAKYSPHESEAPISIQDHGDKQAVRFRNIWARRLDLSDDAVQ
jgi:hypothetical protein